MQHKMAVGSYYDWFTGRHIVAYELYNSDGQLIQSNTKQIKLPKENKLLLSLRAIEFGIQALQYTPAKAVTICTDEPAAITWMLRHEMPRKGYRQIVIRIHNRLRMLPVQVTFRWAMSSELESVQKLARSMALPLSA